MIHSWHGDNEFNVQEIVNAITPAKLIPYARNEHVGEIEISIREIKERGRSTLQALPYNRIPKIMVKDLIYDIVHTLNAFPHESGISATISPGTIVNGRIKYTIGNKTISFGSHAYVHITTTNTTDSRSVPAIALMRSNQNTGQYF